MTKQKSNPNPKCILAWSGGKDSTATGILAKLLNIRIDEIVIVLNDPFKIELDFVKRFEAFMSMEVTVVPAPTFEDYFFRVRRRGKYKGQIYGWPYANGHACTRMLKYQPMSHYFKGKDIFFLVGICAEENRRIVPPNRSLLKEHGMTQKNAKDLCVSHGLLNPLYKYFNRTGCVRCPKVGNAAIRQVKQLEPEKFQWMLDNDHLSPVTFKEYYSFHDYVKHFNI